MKESIKKRIEAVHRGEVPAGYVDTVAGFLPSEWSCALLHAISEVLSEQAGDREFETLSISAGIGFVNQAEKFGKELSGKQYAKYTVLRRGDFAYNKGNSKRYPQGCTYMLREREEAAVPNVFECFRITEGHPEYYEQLFINGFMNKQLTRKINHGVRDDGLLNLTDEDFYSTVLPVPPVAEQQKIAEILTACDRVIELKRQLLEEKRRQKKWLMQELLDPNSAVRIPGFECGKWKKLVIGEECEMFSGGTPKAGKDEYYAEGTIPFIRSGEIAGNKTELFLTKDGYNSSSAKMVEVGDLLYALYGANSGECAISQINGAINQAILCVRPKHIERKVLYYLLCSQKERIIATYLQGGQGNLSAEIIKKLTVELPIDQNHQRRIVEVLQAADNDIVCYETELEEWKQKKKALMQLLLTGLVRVNA